ncbi:ABC transporter ATP-binding protein [Neoroseomonas lacus]|uniref:Sugar ABC transporter ATP-binding protein n=1 Tax=Neoroseomonas lacus TaxID=287609 RepID=A0A917KV03_9PROT|nr:ABC transporter ATP-binding protein [Neoroseomonas lacus]GGJ29304.1 sugar ABC transporter ATP-binding protein [Neoroseomonas lacus]
MALELIDVHKSYPMNVGRKHVLRGINAVFRKGERVGVLGRNGTGKSTLVRILGRVEAPTQGIVRSSMSVSWPIGFAAGFQQALSGADNSRFIARIYDRPVQETVDFVEHFAELGEYLNMPVHTYSSGMRSRLGLAISLAIDFDCFLVDEALAVGDTKFGRAFGARLQRAGLIIVTHQPSLVRQLCNRAAVLDQGTLTFYEDIDEALATYNSL